MTILTHPLINQSALARQLNVSRAFLHQVKSGQAKMPEHIATKLTAISKELADELPVAHDSENE